MYSIAGFPYKGDRKREVYHMSGQKRVRAGTKD